MEQIDLSEIQELLDDILGGTVDFQQLVEQGTSGQSILSWGGILHDFGTIFLQELVMQKRLWVHVLLLAVASAVLLHFAEVFKNRSVSQISFCHDLHDPSVDSDGVLPEQYGDRKRCAACHAKFYDGTGAGVFSCNDDDLLCGFGRGVLRIYPVAGVRPSAGPGIVCAAVY